VKGGGGGSECSTINLREEPSVTHIYALGFTAFLMTAGYFEGRGRSVEGKVIPKDRMLAGNATRVRGLFVDSVHLT
jgi:hypothetical protein